MRSILPVLIFILSIGLSPIFGQPDFYSKQWSSVYGYELRDLPKSALTVVDSIYTVSKREKNIPQFTKALLYQSKFAFSLEENAELTIIQRLEKEIRESTTPQKNILESIIANIYWQYFKENRWKYYQRSRTAEKVNPQDFRTWDADILFLEIHSHFQRSLMNAHQLQSINLSTINEILIQAENSRVYRPTLFDFIAHSAIDFYSSNAYHLQTPTAKRTIHNERYFEEFEDMVINVSESLPSQLHALKIFNLLLPFHKSKNDTTAYINLEIDRLRFIAEEGNFEDASSLHKKALRHLKTIYAQHPSSTQIDFAEASILFTEGNDFNPKTKTQNQFKKREALILCNKAIETFPASEGSIKCERLKESILSPTLGLKAEQYVPINSLSRILVSYTNINSLSLFAYPVTQVFQDAFTQSMNDSLKGLELKKLKPVASWESPLKNLEDHQKHSTEVIIPKLPQGRYLLFAEVPDSSDEIFAYSFIQVTNLSFLESSFQQNYRYQVVDRNNGRPIQGADVHFKTQRTYSTVDPIDEHFTTDKDGFFELKKQHRNSPSIQATIRYQGDEATFGEYQIYQHYRQYQKEEEGYTAKAFIFSDRSIYRPGQTVYFKGILIKTRGKKSSVVSGQYVEVSLEDVNGEEVGLLRLKTNSFGSFSGEFKLPATGLTGEYALYVDEDMEEDSKFYEDLDDFEYSELKISVEEYKRPTFEASFKPVVEMYALNDTIKLTGTGTAYSGAQLIGAKVSYHVKRTVRYPQWYYWNNRSNPSEEEEISYGESTTNSDGEFIIKFVAIPDEAVSKEELPVFQYHVTVDVTDLNGETRSAETIIKVGYHSILARLSAPDLMDRKISENMISVTTENLNGQPVSAKGTIQIYKVKSPATPLRDRPWPSPDVQLLSEEEFTTLFPHDPYQDTGNSQNLKKGKLMLNIPFDTEREKEIKFAVDRAWELGSYIVELSTTDPSGLAVTDLHRFKIYETGNKSIADHQLLIFETDKRSYNVGDLMKLKIGSASLDITVTIDIERDHKITKTFVEHLSGDSKEITIPITETMRDGFAVHGSAVNYNSFRSVREIIPVVSAEEKIEIETITFKDKLQPGSKETWSFEIKGNGAIRKETEILVSMYDASLDQFKPHEWTFRPIEHFLYYSHYQTAGYKSFGATDFTTKNQPHISLYIPRQFYDQLDWFGFTLTNNPYIKRKYIDRLYSSGTDPDKPSKVSMVNSKNKKEGYIYGTITDSQGEPLVGTNVLVKGTTQGTVTDMQGNYIIEADKGDVLVYSFIGYATAEAKVGRKNTIHVLMEEDVQALSEVVVTGYGVEMKKQMLSSAVQYIVSSTDVEVDLVYKLEGRVAGVQITELAGGPAKLVIRGNSALGNNGEPLYIVDGVIVESSRISQKDLANVQVLKGAAATALYGAKAANGVLIITTKSGQKKLDEELAKVSARKDFKETAFFFPHLNTDENGRIRFMFTTPEALTRWKIQLLAHTKDLVTTTKTLHSVTQKELMVTPNAPRFMRVGDDIVFSAKIANLSLRSKTGKVALQLTNAITGEPVDQLFHNIVRNKTFKVGSKGNTKISWKLKVPDGIGAVQYKVVAKAGNFSDGEQNALPVLSNRMLVTETLPMYVRSGQTKKFALDKLRTTTSSSLQHHSLTLEITSNPVWYAIQALPYLMEFPHECAEQIFSRYYANALATSIINSTPQIKEVVEKWASSSALVSNLEKNQELKSIIIQETPWLRDAQNEAEQKKRIALLFDLKTMKDQLQSVVNKLADMQMANGGFPWFGGGRYPSRYITQHIASGMGHLKHLKMLTTDHNTSTILHKAIGYLDAEILEDYNDLLTQANKLRSQAKTNQEADNLVKAYMERKHVFYDQIQYLYMRSFFSEVMINENLTPAVEYYRNQSLKYWKEFNLYMKGMIALIHSRNQNRQLANDIVKSLKENSIVSEELGMYWKENQPGWYWHESPVETQALLIEAFAEIESNDPMLTAEEKRKTIDELRIWLLKNKQTSQWKTTKATTEAVYALLLQGTDWIALDKQVEVTVGNKKIIQDVKLPEAGTGYFKTTWTGEAVTPAMHEVIMTKNEDGIAWGGLYWQYFEDLDKINSAETPLALTKKVFVVKRTDRGELLTEVTTAVPLVVGDLLRIRIELKADRPMEFLHMKDMRAAGLEPIDVLSAYKWQEGLGYYQSTKDASTNFFFDYVPTGGYVFEYDLRVNNKGNFSNGITTIQSMYAPEFSSHSEGIRLSVE